MQRVIDPLSKSDPSSEVSVNYILVHVVIIVPYVNLVS